LDEQYFQGKNEQGEEDLYTHFADSMQRARWRVAQYVMRHIYDFVQQGQNEEASKDDELITKKPLGGMSFH
jgi:hypothetical protein